MFVIYKPRRGTRRLLATAVALPCAAFLAAAPAHASTPNGNACGHFKFEIAQAGLTASAGVSASKLGKCAPATPAPSDPAAPGSGQPAAAPVGDPAGGNGTAEGTPAAPPGNSPSVTASVLLFSGKAVGVPVACPATAPADCTGTIRITVLVKRRTSARSAGVEMARRGRKLTVGKAQFRVSRGTKKTISVRISRRGRVLFNKKPTLKAEVGLETRDPAGRKRVIRKSVRVKRASGARR